MKLLLDTHTALWLFNEHEKLSAKVRLLLLDEANALYISIASVWELAIKASLGKLEGFDGGVRVFLSAVNRHPIELLPIVPDHIALVETLPFLHRDPFDRLLIAAAKAEGMTIVTADGNIHKYDVPSVW
jgi:PIN domain nuclease of toxin-antitoxin system